MDDSKKELKKKQRQQEDFIIAKNIIDDIFNTRYKVEEIYRKNYAARDRLETLFYKTDYLDITFGFGMKEKVKTKIAENALIRERRPKNYYLIEDRWDIFVASEEVYFLKELDFRKLKFASSYLCSGANMDYVVKKHDTSTQSVISFLLDPKLQAILKLSHYENLKRYMNIEKILISNELSAKKTLLFNIVHVLNESNYNLDYALNYFDLPIHLFRKLLYEITIFPYFEEGIKESIKGLLNEDATKKVKSI